MDADHAGAMTFWMITTANLCTRNSAASKLKSGKLNPRYAFLFPRCLTCETRCLCLYREVCPLSVALLVCCLNGNCGRCAWIWVLRGVIAVLSWDYRCCISRLHALRVHHNLLGLSGQNGFSWVCSVSVLQSSPQYRLLRYVGDDTTCLEIGVDCVKF